MRHKKKFFLGLGLLASSCILQAKDYPIGLESVYQSALSVSNEYRALEQESYSASSLTEAEKKYYMPKATLNAELNSYYGLAPESDRTDVLTLNVEMKLWGTGVRDKISAATNNQRASQLVVIGEELSVYQIVLRYLSKIERTRAYLAENEAIEERLLSYVDKQRIASGEGSSSLSSLKEAELEYSRFKDSVSRIRASIDQMFRSLREETNYQTDDNDRVGISKSALQRLLAQDIAQYSEIDVWKTNIELRNRNLLLDYQLKTANAQRERFTISLVNETQMEVLGSDDLNSGDIKSDSYIGIKATYDLFNFQNSQSQKSSYHLYNAEDERVALLKVQLAAQLNSLQQDFLDIKNKRDSLLEQIRLNEDLVSTQENELLIDKLEYVDLVKSLAGLSASYGNHLNYDLSLIDAVVDTMALRSEKFATDD